MARTSPEVLAGQFNTEVNIMHEVAFNQNSSSAIDVDAVGIGSLAVSWITSCGDAVNRVLTHHSIACPVDRRVRRRVFEADHIDSNIVVVVHRVLRYAETSYIAVHHHRLA